jgi:hypothetical protein
VAYVNDVFIWKRRLQDFEALTPQVEQTNIMELEMNDTIQTF